MEQYRLQEVILPIAIVSIVGMMVFPLPSAVLDALLGANIAFSLLLLLTSLAAKEPEKFTTLPSLLLLSTLFRLSLNVSTTRQLLTYGEAPQVVLAFGEFVVGGNVLVGCVIFLIVTLVQFVVVSKGAERVAEVAARFTLDAMPGKQMAIDADIRAGVLSLAEAKERRRELQRESKLFGALDGAMKFVKGDAIAGLCIAALNIGAGLIIGIYQLEMSLADAVQCYTIFTIGDSLVSQIPALLVSVAAGIAVTRVGEPGGSTMSRELVRQLTSEPRVLVTAAFVLLVLACSPGLPFLPFLLLATGAWMIAASRHCGEARTAQSEARQVFVPRALSNLLLQIGLDAREALLREGQLMERIAASRRLMYEEFGVIVPEPEWEAAPEVKASSVSLFLGGVALAACHPMERSDGRTEASCTEQVIRMFETACRENIAQFVDDTQIRVLLDLHATSAEDFINSMIPKQITVTTITRLLRDLVDERVHVRNLRMILQGVAEYCLTEGAIEYPLTESRYLFLLSAVRSALKRQIGDSLPRTSGQVELLELDTQIDKLLAQAALSSSPIAPTLAAALGSALRDCAGPTLVLCSELARRSVFLIARSLGIRVCAVAAGELPEDLPVLITGSLPQQEEAIEGGQPTSVDVRHGRLAA